MGPLYRFGPLGPPVLPGLPMAYYATDDTARICWWPLAAVDVAREAAAPAADAPCSNRSMSPARGAHSSKPAAAAAQNATDRRTDRRTPDSLQTVRALSKITKMFSYFFPINSDFCPCLIMLLLMCSTEKNNVSEIWSVSKSRHHMQLKPFVTRVTISLPQKLYFIIIDFYL